MTTDTRQKLEYQHKLGVAVHNPGGTTLTRQVTCMKIQNQMVELATDILDSLL